MKISVILSAFAIFCFPFSSCNLDDDQFIPSEHITIREEAFSEYNAIEVSGVFTVYITFSAIEESIKVEANENLQPYIEIAKDKDILKIGLTENLNISGTAKLNIYIITNNIENYMASGTARFLVEGLIDTDNVGIYLSGASAFKGSMIAQTLRAELSGASKMDIDGVADYGEMEAGGASVLGDYDFKINKLNINLSGASNAWFTVLQSIDVVASGASNLMYMGTATISSQDLSGASEVKKEG
ncbi:MAG: DUF2807 domain-containing protein [Cyclobacteriaceae bacterium]|nr:DUF2807 domain-containing protein [Cyclobacteriaceae bacterium]